MAINKITLIILFALILTIGGCATTNYIKSETDPFKFDFTPIYTASNTTSQRVFDLGVKLLENEGYLVTPIPAFDIVTTNPISLGYQVWRSTNEKWNISLQVSLQIMKDKRGQLYWRLSHRIIGSRSGTQDRLFAPEDFEVASQRINELISKLSRVFAALA